MHMSKKQKRILNIARQIAYKSTYKRYRHGAVLVKGGAILNTSTNSNDFCSFGTRFRKECGHATMHAELGSILGISRCVTEGSTLYVVRITKNGDFAISKPCKMCESILRHVGIKKVIYTNSSNSIESYKL
jgi:deoxycytidylate deaminase